MDKEPSEFERGVADERERVLVWLEYFREQIGEGYIPLKNRIVGGNDPREPDYEAGRLLP